MWKKNSKVPVAVLSCFLIAFILQGVLKLSGVFIFEKALDWEIFKIIDNSKVGYIIFYSIIVFIRVYCLTFSFTLKPYSKKWYHYVVMATIVIGITTLKALVLVEMKIQIVLDVLIYILIPLFVNFTNNKECRVFDKHNIHSVIITIVIQILLYCCYIGLNYWSSMLSSVVITNQVFLPASTSFLIYFEMYIGIALLMLSFNYFLNYIKKENK